MRQSLHSPSKTHDIDPTFWYKRYHDIVDALGLDPEMDRKATKLLHRSMLSRAQEVEGTLSKLEALISSRSVVIFGCGPSLDDMVQAMAHTLSQHNAPLIAADGATSALLEGGLRPDIVVTDLDGFVPDIVRASTMGALTVLQAHGDNIKDVERWLPNLHNVLPITQTEPTALVRNFGGFTDGDKCLFLASAFGAARVVLVSMDFGPKIGTRSGKNRKESSKHRKLAKLLIGRHLCGELISMTRLPTYSLSLVPPAGAAEIQLGDVGRVLEGIPPQTYHPSSTYRDIAFLFPEGTLSEMILTTTDRSAKAHAAPVGLTRKGKRLIVSLASSARTLNNLESGKAPVLNLVYDPVIFAEAAFGHLPDRTLEDCEPGASPRIRGSAATIKVRLVEKEDFTRSDDLGVTPFQRLSFDVVGVEFPYPPRPYSRGFGLAIEAVIGVTKASVAAERGLHEVESRIETQIRAYIQTASRVGVDKSTRRALDLCESELNHITKRKERHPK